MYLLPRRLFLCLFFFFSAFPMILPQEMRVLVPTAMQPDKRYPSKAVVLGHELPGNQPQKSTAIPCNATPPTQPHSQQQHEL